MAMIAEEPDTPVCLDLTLKRIAFPLPFVPVLAHVALIPAAGSS
jgi:hypothetical protein